MQIDEARREHPSGGSSISRASPASGGQRRIEAPIATTTLALDQHRAGPVESLARDRGCARRAAAGASAPCGYRPSRRRRKRLQQRHAHRDAVGRPAPRSPMPDRAPPPDRSRRPRSSGRDAATSAPGCASASRASCQPVVPACIRAATAAIPPAGARAAAAAPSPRRRPPAPRSTFGSTRDTPRRARSRHRVGWRRARRRRLAAASAGRRARPRRPSPSAPRRSSARRGCAGCRRG